jgi:hypothetical protein
MTLKRKKMATEEHWKLKAIDSIERTDNLAFPTEEFHKIVDTIIKNQQIKDLLFGSNHQQQIATTASEMKKIATIRLL